MSEISDLLSKIKSSGSADSIPELKDIMLYGSIKDLSSEDKKVLLQVMSVSVKTMLRVPKNSESFYTIGEVQEILIKKGYPRTLVNESILLYLRDMHLVE